MATFEAKFLERAYSTPDVAEQRGRLRAAVRARSGERGLDVGCGPGLLSCELAREVGPRGRIVGIDTSTEMIAMCVERARRDALSSRAEFHQGDAADLQFPPASFDFAVASQVYEYVPDLKHALAEAYRVLRTHGRLAILETDWDSCVWQSDDRERTARVLKAWESHFVHPHLPAELPGFLGATGFLVKSLTVVPIVNLQLRDDTYSAGMIGVVSRFVTQHGVSREEAEAWAADIRSQEERGQYFFSLNRYLFLAERPRGLRRGEP